MGMYKRILIEQQDDIHQELHEVIAEIEDSIERGESREERSHLMDRQAELEIRNDVVIETFTKHHTEKTD